MTVRGFMVGSIIAILFFSSLSFAIMAQLSLGEERRAEAQAFVMDGEVLESSEESQGEGLGEYSENGEIQTSMEPVEGVVVHNSTGTIGDEALQNFTESVQDELLPMQSDEQEPPQDEEPQASAEVEASGFESGRMRTVGVAIYSDRGASVPLYSVDWGKLEPGAEYDVNCYIRNTGNSASVLTLGTDNWGPAEAADYISLSWDYDGQVLDVGEVIPVTLTLTVSEDIEGISSFYFEITIIGSGI